MYKISELCGKPVISLIDATILGIVKSIIFDSNLSGKLLDIYVEEGGDVEQKFIPLSAIKSIDYDAVTVYDSDCVLLEWSKPIDNYRESLINNLCYTNVGKLLGRVSDIIMDSYHIHKIVIDNLSFDRSRILSFSSKAVIINDTDKIFRLKTVKKSIPNNITKSQLVSTHNSVGANNIATSVITLPSKISPPNTNVYTASYDFLIGKTLSRALTDDNGKTVLSSGKLLSHDDISKARKTGRLIELAIYSK